MNRFNAITVIGLGLIGGSLCRALRSCGNVSKVVGVDKNPASVDYALEKGFVDQAVTSLSPEVEGAEIVVICTYVETIPEIAAELVKKVPQGCVITDVGSVKEEIVNRIEKTVDPGIYFVGGHPIAGTENSGVRYADTDLFRGKSIYLTTTENTDRSAFEKVKHMWENAGGMVSEINPGVHDRIFALVSHLPHVVAYSLVNSIGSVKDIENIFEYSGGGLRDYTRIAASSPGMWKEIFTMNRKNLLDAIGAFRKSLQEIENSIASDDSDKLLELLKEAVEMNQKFRGK